MNLTVMEKNKNQEVGSETSETRTLGPNQNSDERPRNMIPDHMVGLCCRRDLCLCQGRVGVACLQKEFCV